LITLPLGGGSDGAGRAGRASALEASNTIKESVDIAPLKHLRPTELIGFRRILASLEKGDG
jgi:hypothetical protein